ncbi:MAG: chemotaxis protein CheW [Eubacteriales bacterium]|nr:chemotaxis protein CheW [Eubacteriales bacterium]
MDNAIALSNGQLANASPGDTMQDLFLVFTIDTKDYAIEIRYVIEIIEITPITNVPFLPDCVKGIINLRGTIIPIMDVRLRFGLPEQAYTDKTCIIVVNQGNMSLGLIVDAVQEVTTINSEQRLAPPSINSGETNYIQGVCNSAESIRLLLDCEKLMEIPGKDRG